MSGQVGCGICGELFHEQDGVQGDEWVDHISGTRAQIFIPFCCGNHWVQWQL